MVLVSVGIPGKGGVVTEPMAKITIGGSLSSKDLGRYFLFLGKYQENGDVTAEPVAAISSFYQGSQTVLKGRIGACKQRD